MRQFGAVPDPRNPHATSPREKWSSLGDASFGIGAFIVLLDVITLMVFQAANAISENQPEEQAAHGRPLLALASACIVVITVLCTLGGKRTWLRVVGVTAGALALVGAWAFGSA
jgi:hypothetical protein